MKFHNNTKLPLSCEKHKIFNIREHEKEPNLKLSDPFCFASFKDYEL